MQAKSKQVADLVIFSGGTAMNPFSAALAEYTSRVCYIMPISDDGGSTEEIRRILGGPAIGDIRSRCVRLSSDPNIYNLLIYRLDQNDKRKAKDDWIDILEGDHELWKQIKDNSLKQIIKTFLLHFHTELLRHNDKKNPFDYRNGSIGNFFFTGARLFFNSIESAIFLFLRVALVPPESKVLPVISCNQAVNIGCELENGNKIVGQSNISHPPQRSIGASVTLVDKHCDIKLPHKIKRIFYLNEYYQETDPIVNPEVLTKLTDPQSVIIYGMGSLYTSIIPNLILKGVGECIAKKKTKKILILNGYPDRETYGMTAIDFVMAISNALNRNGELSHSPAEYITHLCCLQNSPIEVAKGKIKQMGIHIVEVRSKQTTKSDTQRPIYDDRDLITKIMTLVSEEGVLENESN